MWRPGREAGRAVEVLHSDYSMEPLLELAKKAGVKYEEKVDLYDGRTGLPYISSDCGPRYYFKLEHLADHSACPVYRLTLW